MSDPVNQDQEPQGRSLLRTILHPAAMVVPQALVGSLESFIPARQTDQGPVFSEPQIASGAYGLLGATTPDLLNAVLPKLGFQNPNLPHLPGADTAMEHAGQSADLVNRWTDPYLPHAETPTEEVLQSALRTGGGMVAPLPGSAFAKLGTAGKIISHIIPPLEGGKIAVPLGAAAGGGLELYAQNKEAQAADLERQAAALHGGDQRPQEINLGLSSTGPPQTSISTVAPATPTPVNTYGANELNLGLTPTGTQAPTFGSQGTTATPFYEIAGEAAAIGLGAWLALKHGGKLWTATSDALRGGERGLTYNQNLAAIGPVDEMLGGAPGKPLTGEAPLPGVAGTPGTKAAQYWKDVNTIPNRYMEAVADPDTARQFSAASGTINNNASMSTRNRAMFSTGVDVATGQTMPSLERWRQDIAQLNPDSQQFVSSAMWAKRELQDRLNMLNDYMSTGGAKKGTGPLPDLRFNFKNTSSDELRNMVNTAESVPEFKKIMDTAWTIGNRNLDIADIRGYRSSEDIAKIRKDNPYYVPSVDENARVINILGPRDITAGGGWVSPPTYAWDAIVQHQDKLYKDMAKNEWLRTIILQGVKAQDADPTLAKVFQEKLGGEAVLPENANDPAKPSRADRALTIGTASGQRTFYVNNTDMYNALRGPPAQINLVSGGLQSMRRTLQSGITGPMSIIGGRVFGPVIGLARNIMQVPIDRTAGTYGGLIDKAVQRATGGIGYRGPDPTTPFGAVGSGLLDAGSVTLKNFANILRDPANPLRMLKGGGWADAAADRLDALYHSSNAAKMAAQGIGGAGARGGVEMPTMVVKGKTGYVGVDPFGGSIPGSMGEPTIPFTNVRIPTTLSHTYVNLRTLIRDIYSSLTDGMHSYYFRLNQNNPNLTGNMLAHEVRRVIGDPGVMGGGKAARYWAAATPFGNISLQDVGRMAEVFRNNPIAFTSALTTHLGLAALASVYTGLISGPDHVKHLEDEISTSSRAGNVILYHGAGTDPNEHTEISMPQRFRPLYAGILELVASAVNAFQAHGDQGLLDRTLNTIGDVFDHHLTNSTVTATEHGLSDLFSFPIQAPPAAALAMAVAGKQQNTDLADVTQQLGQGTVLGALTKNVVSDRQIPGEGRFDSVLSNNDGRSMIAILSALFGNAGSAWHMVDMYRQRNKFPDQDMPIHGLIDDYTSQLADKNPIGNIIWGKTLQQTTRSPLMESTMRSVDAIQRTQGAITGMNEEGFTRKGGLPILPLHAPNMPSDPTMRQMYIQTSRFWSIIEKQYMPMINDIRKQLGNVTEGPLSAETKRVLYNKLAKQENLRWGQIAGVVANLNTGLSNIVGKHVDVRNIDWSRGPDQFN